MMGPIPPPIPPLQTLTVSVRSPYGVETIYPECPLSRLFCELLGQKTLTKENVENIKRLGFFFYVKTNEVKL